MNAYLYGILIRSLDCVPACLDYSTWVGVVCSVRIIVSPAHNMDVPHALLTSFTIMEPVSVRMGTQ